MPTTVYSQREADKFVTTERVDLVVVKCTCGLLFGIPEHLHRSALAHRGPSGWQISCPLGHTWHFTGPDETPEERKLREDLEWERAYSANVVAQLDQTQASLSATKGVVTRLKRRAGSGTCPCCNRTFQQLARHMKAKHPDLAPAEDGHLPADVEPHRRPERFVVEAVLAFVGTDTKSFTEIHQGVGITKGHTSNVLNRMLKSGEIERIAHGRYRRPLEASQ